MDQSLEDLLAKQAIYELSCTYMRGLDRTDADLLHSVFFEDAYCEYGFINGDPAVFIEFAVNALKEHKANQHMIGNVLIDIEGDEIDIVKSIDLKTYKIKVITVENNDNSKDIYDYMLKNGYRYFNRLFIDDLFIRI